MSRKFPEIKHWSQYRLKSIKNVVSFKLIYDSFSFLRLSKRKNFIDFPSLGLIMSPLDWGWGPYWTTDGGGTWLEDRVIIIGLFQIFI